MSAINADIGKSAMEEALVSALHRLGFDTLRKEQDRVVKAFISGQDVFAIIHAMGWQRSLWERHRKILTPLLVSQGRQSSASVH